jgi:exo-beta-1,3-glucanase (GH17 family)
MHVRAGWTAIAAWDRSVDTRPNSNIVWLIPGEWTFDQALRRIQATMPERWSLFVNQAGWPSPGAGPAHAA